MNKKLAKPTGEKKSRSNKALRKRIAKQLQMSRIRSATVNLSRVLEDYDPPPICEQIVVEHLYGVMDPGDIIDRLGISEEEYVNVMKIPENMAWVSAVLMNQLKYLVGMADLKMLEKAVVDGNVQAYKAFVERFSLGGISKTAHVRVDLGGEDAAHLSKEQLERIIEEKTRKAGIGGLIEGTEGPSEGAGGAGAEETESPPHIL